MQPATLSASSILVFQGCEARFKATHVPRSPDLGGEAANLGTACHGALERWVTLGWHFPQQPFVKLIELFDEEYAKLFVSNHRRADGRKMLENWYKRSGDDYWEGRNILSLETKSSFEMKWPDGTPFNVNYIFDRQDWRANGEYEVVDYKSVAMPVQPEELKGKIQPRLYALATQIQYPDAEVIWVTYDLLRYDCVGARFTREDNADTWRYLKKLVQDIWDSDGTHETLNAECRWCIRKGDCDTLMRHANVGGILGITDVSEAIDKRAKVEWAVGALRNHLAELDDFILEAAENDNTLTMSTPNTDMEVKVSGRREVDSERVSPILGPTIMSRYGKIALSDIDALLKGDELTDDQKSQVRQAIRKKMGDPKIKTKARAAIGAEED